MSVLCFSAVVATPGTPQRLVSSTVPNMATISAGGVTSAAGAAVSASNMSVQAAPTNTSAKNIFIGGPGMSVASKTGIGLALLTGSAPVEINFSSGEFTLDDLWIDTDSTNAATERVYVMLVG